MCDSDEEWTLNSGNLSTKSSKNKTKKRNNVKNHLPPKQLFLGSKQLLQSSVDPNCLYTFSKRIVRIEYPGLVKTASGAIETLGGMHGIQMAVADPRNKLDLHFHPENKFCKPCIADRDLSPGILIKVKTTPVTAHPENVKDSARVSDEKYQYEVIGITSLNFKFNRICDFQYVPIVSNNVLINDEPQVNYIYDKILPDSLPSILWFLSKESVAQQKFCIPTNFARFESSQNKLYLNAGEKFGSNVRPEISKLIENYKPRRAKQISTKQVSLFVNLQTLNVQIPSQPLTYTMELIKERGLEKIYNSVKKLFEERPIWSKVAIQYRTGILPDQAKIVLPAVGYFCPMGAWRMTWIRYEYNPQKDAESRIYQTLDYRIRATEGAKLKVNAKRSYSDKQLFYVAPTHFNKVSLKDNIDNVKKNVLEENSYILRPNYIPPARQMFYQYCDILLPEIQDMVSRLPKVPSSMKFDPKNGWLPVNFTEQCREIVNKYVMDRVQEELLEDTIKLQQQQNNQLDDFEREDVQETSSTYCSKMLSNIKRGIYKSVNVTPMSEISIKDANVSNTDIPTVDLLEEINEDELEQVDADDVVNSIPERLEENSDDEHLSQTSDLDIDMEAVEEVNKMIAGIHDEVEVNIVASYLKKNTLVRF